MKKLIIVSLILASVSTFADDLCNNYDECKALQSQVDNLVKKYALFRKCSDVYKGTMYFETKDGEFAVPDNGIINFKLNGSYGRHWQPCDPS